MILGMYQMNEYEAVLNSPDYQARKEALDKLCSEKIAEGMARAFKVVATRLLEHRYILLSEAAELEKGNEL